MDRGEQPSQHTSQVLQMSDPDQEQLFTVSYSCQIPKDFQPLSDPNLNFAFTWSCNCKYNGPKTNTTCSCMNAEVKISMVDTIKLVREKPLDTALTLNLLRKLPQVVVTRKINLLPETLPPHQPQRSGVSYPGIYGRNGSWHINTSRRTHPQPTSQVEIPCQ